METMVEAKDDRKLNRTAIGEAICGGLGLASYAVNDVLSKEALADFNELLGSFPNANQAERLEIVNAIRELFAPSDYFGVNDAPTIDEWINSDPEIKTAISNLTQSKRVFAERVRRIMAEKGLNQDQLAERLGVTQPTVAAYLSGHHKPQPRTLSKLAHALGIEISNLWPET